MASNYDNITKNIISAFLWISSSFEAKKIIGSLHQNRFRCVNNGVYFLYYKAQHPTIDRIYLFFLIRRIISIIIHCNNILIRFYQIIQQRKNNNIIWFRISMIDRQALWIIMLVRNQYHLKVSHLIKVRWYIEKLSASLYMYIISRMKDVVE